LAAKIASGRANEETQRKLLAQRPFPLLDDIITFCHAEESSAKDTKHVVSGGSKHVNAVGRLQGKMNKGKFKKGGNKGKHDNQVAKKPTEGKPQEWYCKFCG
jgi:hypothetical protein